MICNANATGVPELSVAKNKVLVVAELVALCSVLWIFLLARGLSMQRDGSTVLVFTFALV